MPHLGLGPWIEGTADDSQIGTGAPANIEVSGLAGGGVVGNTRNDGPYVVGSRYTFITAEVIKGISFYKEPGDTTTTRTLALWSDGGTLLQSVVTSSEPASGKVFGTFATPYNVAASEIVRAGCDRPNGQTWRDTSTAAVSLVPSRVTVDTNNYYNNGNGAIAPSNLGGHGCYYTDIFLQGP